MVADFEVNLLNGRGILGDGAVDMQLGVGGIEDTVIHFFCAIISCHRV